MTLGKHSSAKIQECWETSPANLEQKEGSDWSIVYSLPGMDIDESVVSRIDNVIEKFGKEKPIALSRSPYEFLHFMNAEKLLYDLGLL